MQILESGGYLRVAANASQEQAGPGRSLLCQFSSAGSLGKTGVGS